jgi:hypothetical protein
MLPLALCCVSDERPPVVELMLELIFGVFFVHLKALLLTDVFT